MFIKISKRNLKSITDLFMYYMFKILFFTLNEFERGNYCFH